MSMSKEQYGAYFGVTVDRAGYFKVFSRQGTQRLLGWRCDVPVIAADCVSGDETASVINEMIRDLERLKIWAIRYGKSAKYDRDQTEAWTGRQQAAKINENLL
jgi:hypothetical protein